MPKLLLDEDLSPWAANELRADGVDAVHVRDRKMLGTADTAVLERAYEEDRILITANIGDFRKLAARWELHPGIVLIEDGALLRVEQLETI